MGAWGQAGLFLLGLRSSFLSRLLCLSHVALPLSLDY